MQSLKICCGISISINEGGVHLYWADNINGCYTQLAKMDVAPTPGVDALTTKEVESVCTKLGGIINALFAEERKQTLDPASSPKLMLDGSDLEKYVASALLKIASQSQNNGQS